MTTYLKVHFTVYIFVTIILSKLSFGLPVRSLLLLALAGILFAFYTNLMLDFVKRQYGILLLLFSIGVLGAILATQNDVSIFLIFHEFNRVILQIVLTMACTYAMCEIAGPRFVVYVLLSCLFVTGTVAVLQFMQVEFFWNLRIQMAQFMSEDQRVMAMLLRKDRAFGLSATTMNLAYQSISLLVACYVLTKARFVSIAFFNLVAVLIFIVAVVSEVRSLVIGVALTILIFNIRENFNKQTIIFLVAIFVAGVILMLLGTSSRLTSASDGSAVARLVLIKYGSLLIIDKPFGYGWGFSSTEQSWAYWSYLVDFKNTNAVRSYGLHNYFIGFLVEYGIIGFFLILLAALTNFAKFTEFLILFSGYLINSFFHNGGPFTGAIYFWMAFTIFSYLLDKGYLQLSVWSSKSYSRASHAQI